MKALVYHGPGQKSWDTVPDPAPAEPTDIVVQIDTTTICGTDLHILKGDVPAVTDGRILGHEAVGTVTAVGSAVNLASRLCAEAAHGEVLVDARTTEMLRAVSHDLPVSAAMITQFASLSPDAHVNDAVETVLHTSQSEFPVVDAAARPVGVLGRSDLIRALKQLLAGLAPAPPRISRR